MVGHSVDSDNLMSVILCDSDDVFVKFVFPVFLDKIVAVLHHEDKLDVNFSVCVWHWWEIMSLLTELSYCLGFWVMNMSLLTELDYCLVFWVMDMSLLTELSYCLGFSGYEYIAPDGAGLLVGFFGL